MGEGEGKGPHLAHPVCFPFLFSLQHPLFSSLFSRENCVRGNRQIFGSEPSLRLVWAQNQPIFRPNRQNAGDFAENPCIPGNYPATAWLGILSISSILPLQILPQTSSQTQGNSRVSRMEHQTPSVFTGNFRKRKVLLGTLCVCVYTHTHTRDPLFSFLFSGKLG